MDRCSGPASNVFRRCLCLRTARNHTSPLLLPITLSTPGNAIARSFLRRYVVQGRRGWWDLQACILMRLLGWLDKSIIFWSMPGSAVESTRCPRQTAAPAPAPPTALHHRHYLTPHPLFHSHPSPPSTRANPFYAQIYVDYLRSDWRRDNWCFPSTLLTSNSDHSSTLES